MPGLTEYRFESLWKLPAGGDPAVTAERVYQALHDIVTYPQWWPQIRTVHRTGDTTGTVSVRSALPYTLTLDLAAKRQDPVARVLAADVAGDLTGLCGWRVVTSKSLVLAKFTGLMDVNTPFLKRTGSVLRPVLKANHRWMMSAGERGLRAHLAAG